MESSESPKSLYALIRDYTSINTRGGSLVFNIQEDKKQTILLEGEILKQKPQLELVGLAYDVADNLMIVHTELLHGRRIQYHRLTSALSENEYRDYRVIQDLLDLSNISGKGLLYRNVEQGLSIDLFGDNYIGPILSSLGGISAFGVMGSLLGATTTSLNGIVLGGAIGISFGGFVAGTSLHKNPLKQLSEIICQRADYVQAHFPK